MRYHTPVGPVRFDFSYNLNPPIYPINTNYSLDADTIPGVPPYETARGRRQPLQLLLQPGADLLMRAGSPIRLLLLAVCLACARPCLRRSAPSPQSDSKPVVLDHVVAVVNNQAILASDLDDEIRLAVLDPGRGGLGGLTPPWPLTS